MSNYLAIATVTATLQRTLQTIIQVDVEGARVTTVRPDVLGSGAPETGVNIYLYHVMPNPAWRNADLRTRYTEGAFAKRPQAALDLYYMISCHGNETELEPQRLLGSVVRTLHARPVLTSEAIRDTLADSTFAFLLNSNLSEQVDTVKFMPLSLTVEELSNIWSVFFQTPHSLSMAYQASTVLIESDDIPQRALPVRDRSKFSGMPFTNTPLIDRVISTKGRLEPIIADSTLLIQGTRLRHERAVIRIGDAECTAQKQEEHQITLQLAEVSPGTLRAGIQGLQVIHHLQDPTTKRYRGVESNVMAIVLRPTIQQINIAEIDETGDDLRTAEVTVELNLTVSPQQRAILLLNEASTNSPAAYLFDGKPRNEDRNTVTFGIVDVKPGEYLVRVQIDGAESLLEVDTNRESPTFERYNAPLLVIP